MAMENGTSTMAYLKVVIQSDEDVAPAKVPCLKEALVDCLEDRDNVQHDQSQHGGEDKRPSPYEFVAFSGSSFFNSTHNFTPFLLLGRFPDLSH